MFDFGLSLPIIAALFLCTLFALNRLLFRPLQAVIEERERLSAGSLDQAERTLESYQVQFERYHQEIKAAQLEGYQLQDVAREDAQRLSAQQISQARGAAEETIAQMKADLAHQVAESKEQLKREAQELAGRITALILRESA